MDSKESDFASPDSASSEQESPRRSHRRRQPRNSALTSNGTTWERVKADWMTGAFSVLALSEAHGIDRTTLRHRMARDNWPPRPTAALVQQALPGAVLDSCIGGDEETIEATISLLEGRGTDADRLAAERAGSEAKRKAAILRDHRKMANDYGVLANRVLFLLTNYANGVSDVTFVQGKDHDGALVRFPFHLLSRQHGLMDGVHRLGTILEMAIRLQRVSNGLEDVDGDGNPKRAGAAGGSAVDRSKSDDELLAAVHSLMESLQTPSRMTPVPPGLVNA